MNRLENLPNVVYVSVACTGFNPPAEHLMNLELISTEPLPTQASLHYTFVVDADLVHVGGGSAIADY